MRSFSTSRVRASVGFLAGRFCLVALGAWHHQVGLSGYRLAGVVAERLQLRLELRWESGTKPACSGWEWRGRLGRVADQGKRHLLPRNEPAETEKHVRNLLGGDPRSPFAYGTGPACLSAATTSAMGTSRCSPVVMSLTMATPFRTSSSPTMTAVAASSELT